ncbi:antitoxin VapB family protein [Halorutilales archaeon Cl-col2-1]
MSKNISISDEVYEKLSREKDGKSFSEVIDEKIEEGSIISDVAGQRVLDEEIYRDVKEDIGKLSEEASEQQG